MSDLTDKQRIEYLKVLGAAMVEVRSLARQVTAHVLAGDIEKAKQANLQIEELADAFHNPPAYDWVDESRLIMEVGFAGDKWKLLTEKALSPAGLNIE
jgi:hypothetical protein